jgi:hypothetical protein
MELTPFLNLQQFLALWDGPPLTTHQENIVNLLAEVASNWIYNNGPQGNALPSTDPTARFVTYDVVQNAVRYQKYSKLSNFSRAVGHRVEGGSFDNPMQALDFTDTHYQLLQIPLRALPLAGCPRNDFFADDQMQGWPTRWSSQFENQGWDYWTVNND